MTEVLESSWFCLMVNFHIFVWIENRWLVQQGLKDVTLDPSVPPSTRTVSLAKVK